MRIEMGREQGIVVMKMMERRLDARISNEFNDVMIERIEMGDTLFLLDMTNVEFIDSSGLGAIVSSLKRIGRNGDITICGPQETVMSLLKLTRMDRIFRIFPNEAEALASMTS